MAPDTEPAVEPAVEPEPVVITEPGVYALAADVYHADPVPEGSLSVSGAKLLLPPNCPALFEHDREAGNVATKAMETGTAAHTRVFGTGQSHVVVEAADWKTKAAQTARKGARAEGKIPLLAHEAEKIDAMAAALRRHGEAAQLLDPDTGVAEQCLFWQDEETGIWRRAMLDFLRFPDDNGYVYVIDYKTGVTANPADLGRTIFNFGYYMQHAWYLDGVNAFPELSPYFEPIFLFVFQEKTPPYLVSVVQLHPDDVRWGRLRNRKALDVYQRCTDLAEWPGYPDEIVSVSMPGWADKQLHAAYDRGDFDLGAPR